MFTEMHVRNFKSWQESGPIKMEPVTGFFGTNSSGKSSLLQALLLMKQTTESADRRQVLDLGDEDSLVSLGLIGDVLHRHDLKSRLEFGFSWRSSEPIWASDPTDPDVDLFVESDLSFHTSIRVQSGVQYVERFSYNTGDVNVAYSRRKQPSRKVREYDLQATIRGDAQYLKRIQGRAWGLPPPVRCYGFPHEAFAYFQNSEFMYVFELELERQFGEQLFYLGPLRRFPNREYRWQGAMPSSVGIAGGRTIEALLASDQQPKIARALKSNGYAKKLYPPRDVVGTWLRELDLLQEFDIKRLTEDTDIYRVEVQRAAGSARVQLPDVGFGVSQVLPVLALLACVPKGSVVVLEQPELHLHPSVQSGLADVILETARVRRAQIIVESHSEHLLTRIQRRIAEDEYPKDDVALYFCAQDEGRSRIESLGLDEFGRFSNWPQDFFGDLMGEAGAMVKAGARRTQSR